MRIEPITPMTAVQPPARGLQPASATAAAPLPDDAGQLGTGRDLAEAARAFNEAAQPYDISLRFSQDEETGATVIRVVDQSTGELVRQIPDEALLKLSAALGKLQGALFARSA